MAHLILRSRAPVFSKIGKIGSQQGAERGVDMGGKDSEHQSMLGGWAGRPVTLGDGPAGSVGVAMSDTAAQGGANVPDVGSSCATNHPNIAQYCPLLGVGNSFFSFYFSTKQK